MGKDRGARPGRCRKSRCPIHTSHDFSLSGAGPQDGEKPKSPPTAGRAPDTRLSVADSVPRCPYVIRDKCEKEEPPLMEARPATTCFVTYMPKARKTPLLSSDSQIRQVSDMTYPPPQLRQKPLKDSRRPPGKLSFKRLQIILRARLRGEDLI